MRNVRLHTGGENGADTEARSRASSSAANSSTCMVMGIHLQPDTIHRMESMVFGVRRNYWVSTRTWNMTSSDAKDS